MSSLFAVCPAPFQKPKKKAIKKNGSRKPHGVSAETPLPTILDRFVTSSEGQQPHQHQASSDQPNVTKINSSEQAYHHHCNCCESSEYGATCGSVDSSHTSGYQTDDGTFEGKMLKRASRARPANLRMTAIRDYAPCCNEELAVRRGQRVKVLYKNNDWVYAVTKSGEAGYIPYSFVRPSRKYAGYQSEPEYCQGGGNAYQSGYDTDMPVTTRSGAGRRHGHGNRAQIGDVMPAYSVHTGFRGNVSPEVHTIQSHHSPVEHQKRSYVSGYTSAVEYPAGSGMEQRSSRHPRSAKSMHTLADHITSSHSPREHRPSERKPEIDSFDRNYLEELVVIHDFEAKEEDEVFIAKGEVIKVLNADDPFWLWIETTPGDQGFVPRSCCSLGNHPLLQSNAAARGRTMSSSSSRLPPPGPATGSRHTRRYYHHQDRSRVQSVARQARSQAKQRFHELARLRKDPQNPVLMEKEDIQRIGSKLIVLMDYTATQEDELNIQFAETVFADVLRQGGSDRIWAYCPRTDQCGFVPVSLVIPPVV